MKIRWWCGGSTGGVGEVEEKICVKHAISRLAMKDFAPTAEKEGGCLQLQLHHDYWTCRAFPYQLI